MTGNHASRRIKGVSKNSNFFVSASKHRAENPSVHEIHEGSSTELPTLGAMGPRRQSRKKCIFRDGLKASITVRVMLAVILFVAFLPTMSKAQTISVEPGDGTLQSAIDKAATGATLLLQQGIFTGTVVINKPLTLTGQLTSILDGGGEGHVVMVDAPEVVIRGLSIIHSGGSLATEDSGVFVTANGDNALIKNNHLEHNLIGVYLKGPDNALVLKNRVLGSQNPYMNDRGNAIHIWNSSGSVIEKNHLTHGRDGIFVTTSRNNSFRENLIENMRFAIHYMYTNNSHVMVNRSVDNHTAYALMFSEKIEVSDNVSESSRDRGLLLNFVNYSSFKRNVVRGGTDKCVFIYNANFNQFDGNYFEACNIGIHFTAGSAQKIIVRNSFVDNRHPVKYVGTRHIEWSDNGEGNYWSDNPAFDLDNDGIADVPYQPNDLFDQIVWRYPLAKLLLNSPTTQLLEWAQSEFPLLHPGCVIDSAALMEAQMIDMPILNIPKINITGVI
jgi:nitrous oxidase accessory protein